MFWVLAVIFGIAWGIGSSFALMALLLSKSNNIGDSRDEIEKYGLGVTMTTTEDFGAIGGASPIIDSYCEASMAMFTHDKSMIEFSNHALKTVPARPLERYIPTAEDKIADEAAKKIAQELKEEGVAAGVAASKRRPAPLWDAPKPKPEPKPEKEIFDPVEAEIAMMFGDDVPTGPIDPEAQQFLRPDAPVYEAPTASKPLWEAADPNDDFSDFEEDEF